MSSSIICTSDVSQHAFHEKADAVSQSQDVISQHPLTVSNHARHACVADTALRASMRGVRGASRDVGPSGARCDGCIHSSQFPLRQCNADSIAHARCARCLRLLATCEAALSRLNASGTPILSADLICEDRSRPTAVPHGERLPALQATGRCLTTATYLLRIVAVM